MRDRDAGVYRVSLTPADIGRRVSVRRVLRDGRAGLGDVVGDLEAWADGVLTVRTRGGEAVAVAEADVVAAKVVPPPPARRGGAAGTDES